MKRIERVRRAIAHLDTPEIPSSIMLDGEANQKYYDLLFKKYADQVTIDLLQDGVLNKGQALDYALGNHVLPVYCPWWNWYDLPPEYAEFDPPDFMPKTIGTGSYERFAQQVANIKACTDAYVLVPIWGSHFEKAYFARGIENFLADMAGYPEYAQELLDFIIHKNIVMLENIIHTPGIDGILLGSDWGSQKDLLMSPSSWRTMIRPGEIKEYEMIHSVGIDVWVHSCGDIQRILPDLADMKVDVLNPLQPECMDIAKAKQDVGDRITFWGGISTQNILPYGTPEDVRNETIRVARLLSQSGGYITAPSQAIQKDVPFENICALIDTAKELAGNL